MKLTNLDRNRRTKVRGLALEVFETRTLLAGNVFVAVDDGSLVVTGDSADNGVAIQQTNTGRYVVTGFDLGGTTTVNGGTAPVVMTDVTKDILVDLRDGNDALVMSNSADNLQALADSGTHGTAGTITPSPEASDPSVAATQLAVPRNLLIQIGAGDDSVGLNVNVGQTTAGTARIDTGAGADTAFIQDSQIHDDLTLDAGDGADTVTFDGVEANDSIFANLGGGDDHFTAQNLQAARLGLYGSAGADQLGLTDSEITAEAVIFGGAGDDRVSASGITAGDLTLNAGDGNDQVSLLDSTVSNSAMLSMGNGNDAVRLDNLSVEESLVALMGAGTDSLTVRNTDAHDAYFNGGAGRDTLDLGAKKHGHHNSNTNSLGKVFVSSFETKLGDEVKGGHGYGDRNHEHEFQHGDHEHD
jgi:hypothetical protein